MDTGKVHNQAPVAFGHFASPPRKNEFLKVRQPEMDKGAVLGSLSAGRLWLPGGLRRLLARPKDRPAQHIKILAVLFVMEKPRNLSILAVHGPWQPEDSL